MYKIIILTNWQELVEESFKEVVLDILSSHSS